MERKNHAFGSIVLLRFRVFVLFAVASVLSLSAQTFTPSAGRFEGRTTEANPLGKYTQQTVHTDSTVIFALPATDLRLTHRSTAFYEYVRWFDYATGKRAAGLTTDLQATYEAQSFGSIIRSEGNRAEQNAAVTYRYVSGDRYIACDQSAYSDGSFNGNRIVEPTLSQRLIYCIHPASQMAAKVDAATGNNWLEEEVELTAPVGRQILIGPKYGYTAAGGAAYPNYYYNAGAPVLMESDGREPTVTITESPHQTRTTTNTETVYVKYENTQNGGGEVSRSTQLPKAGADDDPYVTRFIFKFYAPCKIICTETVTTTTVTTYTITTTTSNASAGGSWYWVKGNEAMSVNPSNGQYVQVSSDQEADVRYSLRYVTGAAGTTTSSITVTETKVTKTVKTQNYKLSYSTSGFLLWVTHSNYKWVTDGEAVSQSDAPLVSKTESEPVVNASGATPSVTYNIARFLVHYRNRSKVGPASPTAVDTACLKGCEILAKQDFNFASGLGASRHFYRKPLAVEESTFGFYDGTASGHPRSASANWNEYHFVNSGYAYEDHDGVFKNLYCGSVDSDKGYALYADGSQKPGTVFSLNFNAKLCPGAIMYFSAWVGDANRLAAADGTLPDGASILDFIVVGVDDRGVEHNLMTYTTGGIVNQTGWERVLFPIEFTAPDNYVSYRLRVVNKAKTTTSNDFFLEDVFVYLKPAPLQPIEASTGGNCLSEEGTPLSLYTRVDFAQIALNQTFYYCWFDEAGHVVSTDYYVKKEADDEPFGSVYGEFKVPARYTGNISGFSTASSFRQFDQTNRQASVPSIAYIQESNLTPLDDGNTSRFVAYISTPMNVKPGQKYTCVLAIDPSGLRLNNDNCANAASIVISSGMSISSVAGGGFIQESTKDVCANYSYDLSLINEYAAYDEKAGRNVKKTCPYVAHWLFGTPADVAANPDLYGASFETIEAKLRDYTPSASADPVISRLVQTGLLSLCKYNADGTPDKTDIVHFVMPLNGETRMSYTAFPVIKVDDNAPECASPRTITLTFPEEEGGKQRNALMFVKNYNEKEPAHRVPSFVSSRPRRVRIPEYEYGTAVRFDAENVKVLLTDAGNRFKLGALTLFASDDADAALGSEILSYESSTGEAPMTGENAYISFAGFSKLKPGCSYTFKLLYYLLDENGAFAKACLEDGALAPKPGEAYITFLVVPDLIWFKAAGDAAWNDDYNWEHRYTDQSGIEHVASTFAPLPETSVAYVSGDHILPAPDVQTRYQEPEALIEEKALPYISYDINFEPYTCRRVYVPAHASIVDQHFIRSTDAWQFDMPVVPNQWNMTAMPIHGVVTGDMFIPYNTNAGDESRLAPFKVDQIAQKVGTYAADRLEYGVYNLLYNAIVYHEEASHGSPYRIDISSTSWSLATNSLHTPILDAMSWSLGLDVLDASKSYVMRLPKDENVYNYFRTDYWVGSNVKQPETIARPADYGRPVVDAAEKQLTLYNDFSGNIFIFGNPSFAYLDLTKFYDANRTKITNVFYLSGVENGSQYEHNTGMVDEALRWTSTGNARQQLAPYSGVMVVAREGAVVQQDGKFSLTLDLTNEMLVTSAGKRAPTASRVAAEPSYPREIRIAAEAENYVSRALLKEDESAHIEALQDEDAEALLLDEMLTPFVIYTVGSGKPLAINMIPADTLVAVPLALAAQHKIASEMVTFSGDDAYLSDWDLIDNLTGSRSALFDGFSLQLSMPVDATVRYYLEHARNNAPDVHSSLEDVSAPGFKAYALDGLLTVYSSEDMHNFFVYDAAGRTLASAGNAGRLQQLSLSPGVYMVLADGMTQKVIVK